MPIIRVEMLKGRTTEQKRALVDKLTAGFAESCGGNPDKIYVMIDEIEAENWAVGGQLLSDKSAN